MFLGDIKHTHTRPHPHTQTPFTSLIIGYKWEFAEWPLMCVCGERSQTGLRILLLQSKHTQYTEALCSRLCWILPAPRCWVAYIQIAASAPLLTTAGGGSCGFSWCRWKHKASSLNRQCLCKIWPYILTATNKSTVASLTKPYLRFPRHFPSSCLKSSV